MRIVESLVFLNVMVNSPLLGPTDSTLGRVLQVAGRVLQFAAGFYRFEKDLQPHPLLPYTNKPTKRWKNRVIQHLGLILNTPLLKNWVHKTRALYSWSKTFPV